MHKILVSGKKFEGTLLFELDEEGVVRQFTNEAQLNRSQINWLSAHFPLHLDLINDMQNQGLISARLIEADLSFDSFWTNYDYKVGKTKASRFWEKLTKTDKLTAMENIDPYNYYLSVKSHVEKMYPATYLNPLNRKFEDDYRSLLKK